MNQGAWSQRTSGSHSDVIFPSASLALWRIKMIPISFLHKKSLVSKWRVYFAAKFELLWPVNDSFASTALLRHVTECLPVRMWYLSSRLMGLNGCESSSQNKYFQHQTIELYNHKCHLCPTEWKLCSSFIYFLKIQLPLLEQGRRSYHWFLFCWVVAPRW